MLEEDKNKPESGTAADEINGPHDTSENIEDGDVVEPPNLEDKAEKEPKERQEETEYEEEYEEEEYEEDDDDNGKRSKIIIISAIIIAVLAAGIGFFMYQNIKDDENDSQPQQVQQVEATETPTPTEPAEETTEAEVDEDEIEENNKEEIANTPIPTSTPKPLPTATPVPVDETGNEYNDNTEEMTYTEDDLTSDSQGVAKTVLIGDLRFREMANVASSNDYGWICSGQGDYEWLTDTAFTQADGMIGDGTTVLINIGINDIDRYTEYASAINSKAAEWKSKGATVYFVAVGPVSSQNSVSNQDICAFNTYMYNNLDIQFIDAYNHLVNTGFESVSEDSSSYTDATSTELYNYIMGFL